MASPKIEKIILKGVYVDGKKCKNASVELLDYPGVDVSCIDDKKGEYKFQLPEGVEHKGCFNFKVSCVDYDCTNCSEIITKCLCEAGTCGDCETCGDDGFCHSRCDEGQLCNNDTCVDCLPGTCKGGKVCVNGTCVCPNGTTMLGDRCVDCDPDTYDELCSECRDGKVFEKCPDQACDPETGECLDCIYDGHCDQTNGCQKCADDNKCECCDGYVRNFETGHCDLLPPNACKNNEDCNNPCYSCKNIDPRTGYGTCEPIDCGPGKICHPEYGCVFECDCVVRDCTNGGSSCADHPTESGKCYCHNCGDASCTTEGGECGPNNDKDACICNNNSCEPNPCNGVITPQGWSCNGGVPTPPGGNGPNCTQRVSLVKNESNCTVTANLNANCCPCPRVCVNPNVGRGLYNGTRIEHTYRLSYRKYSCDGPLFDQEEFTGVAYNENISGGGVEIQATLYNEDGTITAVNNNPNSLYGGVIHTGVTPNGIVPFFSTGYGDIDIINDGTLVPKFHSYKLEVYRSQFSIGGAGCTYPRELLYKTYYTILDKVVDVDNLQQPLGDVPRLGEFVEIGEGFDNENIYLASNSCANPLFRWEQGGLHIRELYLSPGTKSDTISWDNTGTERGGTDKMRPCVDLTLYTDCACNNPQTIDTDFCNPNLIEFNFTDECRKEVDIVVPRSCKLHFRNGSYWVVTLDGEEQPRELLLDVPTTRTYNKLDNSPIGSAVWTLYCEDGKEVCNQEDSVTPEPIVVPTEADCAVVGTPQDENCGTINIPDGLGTVSTINNITTTTGVIPTGTILNGRTFTVCGVNLTSIQVRVEPCDGAPYNENISIPNRLEDCTITVDRRDPCSCDSRNTDIPGISECFGESITWDITGFNRLVIENVTGVIYDNTGKQLTASDLQTLVDAQTGNIINLEFCVSPGSYNVEAYAESDIETVVPFDASNSNDCQFACCCNVTGLKFQKDVVCANEVVALEIYGSEECVLTFDVTDITGGLPGTSLGSRNVNFNGSGVYVQTGLTPGRTYKYELVSSNNACNGVPSLESSIVIRDASNITAVLENCTVVSGDNQFEIRVFDTGNPVTNAIFAINGVQITTQQPSAGIYTGIVNQNTTVTVTVPGTSGCESIDIPLIVNCTCDGLTADITGGQFCSGSPSAVLNTTVPSTYNATWDYNNGAQTGSGPTFTVNNPQNGLAVTVTWTEPGTGCTTDRTVILSESGNLSVNINQTPISGCPDETVYFSTNNPVGYNYTWAVLNNTAIPAVTQDPANPWNSNSAGFIIPNPANFPYTVEVTVTDPITGCTGTAIGTINEATNCSECNCNITATANGCDIDVQFASGSDPSCVSKQLFYEVVDTNGNTVGVNQLVSSGVTTFLVNNNDDYTVRLTTLSDPSPCTGNEVPVTVTGCTIPDTWDCESNSCVVKTDGTGAFSTEQDCIDNCIVCTGTVSLNVIQAPSTVGGCDQNSAQGNGRYNFGLNCNDPSGCCGNVTVEIVETLSGLGNNTLTQTTMLSGCGSQTGLILLLMSDAFNCDLTNNTLTYTVNATVVGGDCDLTGQTSWTETYTITDVGCCGN